LNSFHEARSAYEREFILRKLQEHRWNMTQTASALGLEPFSPALPPLHRPPFSLLTIDHRPEQPIRIRSSSGPRRPFSAKPEFIVDSLF